METTQTSNRIHPLVAGAAASVMLVSLVGVAAITGLFPNSHGTVADNSRAVTQPAGSTILAPAYAVAPAITQQSGLSAGSAQQ